MHKTYHAIGLMSGSSLDGLDIAYCRLDWDGISVVNWHLEKAETLSFSDIWVKRLAALPEQNALTFAQTDIYFAYYMGGLVNEFINKHQIGPLDFIASHGHTIFHDPSKRYSVQIGNGNALAATTGKTVICDFRMQDVALNGEGAPLAPMADAYLFPGYDFYMNIGGIANISAQYDGKWVAFDVAPANQVFNFLSEKVGKPFDKDGEIASSGKPHPEFLEDLQSLDFFGKTYPKSMGNEWIRKEVLPLFTSSGLPLEDQMATAVEFLAQETAAAISLIRKQEHWPESSAKMLLSGGGTYNKFFVERLSKAMTSINIDIKIPESAVINYKEALLMALLGLLRLEEKPNSMPSVTGANRATVNGGIYLG